ncbi:hypothetical protein PN419_00210 [Halorubrum ezzemoulense]|uniref:hypothetical protein n=1 Tax=Halorubrum ezzemoulense TaxID=337243 RepID=UPI00232D4E8F|nr:hypothetical protein [Halorubrum ezzemoulense]MDB9247429.1 hypothetical protein [Halorubrum ezzemoulense]MDB9258662.1 hypothetical protein [Halorubrum ezzemoulense]MDB9264480.1 hypothetical protein [Halorubrum ezzemoulense]MDB9269023.1 hypothetical protein [Halorubrum ezzemoulense]MDB9271448.1 hypothetical protein [Halorubrum ezzemoulense]
MSEPIDSFHDPTWGDSKRMRCPHCGQSLPIDPRGECDNCGAHLRVVVETIAPPQTEVDDG